MTDINWRWIIAATAAIGGVAVCGYLAAQLSSPAPVKTKKKKVQKPVEVVQEVQEVVQEETVVVVEEKIKGKNDFLEMIFSPLCFKITQGGTGSFTFLV